MTDDPTHFDEQWLRDLAAALRRGRNPVERMGEIDARRIEQSIAAHDALRERFLRESTELKAARGRIARLEERLALLTERDRSQPVRFGSALA